MLLSCQCARWDQTVLAAQKSRWIAFLLLVKSLENDWAYLVEDTMQHYVLAQLLSSFHFVCPYLSPHKCLSLSLDITGHPDKPTQPQTDCPYSYIHHAMGHLLPHIDMVPALLEMNSWQRGDFPRSVKKMQAQHFLKHHLYLTRGNRKQETQGRIT